MPSPAPRRRPRGAPPGPHRRAPRAAARANALVWLGAATCATAARVREDVLDAPRYVDSPGLQYMLAFTVTLALAIGCVLLWLGRRGRVIWLQAWSVCLIAASLSYLGAAMLGYT